MVTTPMPGLARVRSALFTPADRLDRVAKARQAGADCVIVDLEDGVGAAAKDAARRAVLHYLAGTHEGLWVLRINHVKTRAGLLDFLALRESGKRPPAVMLPKVETVAEIDIAIAHLTGAGALPAIVTLVESAAGLHNSRILARHPAVEAIAFGGADLAADLGAELAWEPLLHARSRLVEAAAYGGVEAWDVPFLDFRDDDGLRQEAAAAKALGFSAKMAIHPAQIAGINAAFTPGEAQIAFARRVMLALGEAGGGAASLDGRMIDEPAARAARRTLARVRPLTDAGIARNRLEGFGST